MRGTGGLWRLGTITIGIGLACGLAAGCGGGDKTLDGPDDNNNSTTSAAPSSSAPSSSAPSSSAPTGSTQVAGDPRSPITWKVREPGGSSDVAAVLSSYQNYLKATTQLKGKPVAASPLVATVATGAAQSQLAESVSALANAHQEVYGPITSYPEVTETDAAAGTATVLDCPNFSHFLTGGKASGPTQPHRPLKATLSNSTGSWKVDNYATTDMSACVGVQ